MIKGMPYQSRQLVLVCLMLFVVFPSCVSKVDETASTKETPHVFYSDGYLDAEYIAVPFSRADSNYLAIHHASDNNLYFGISSHLPDTHCRFYKYNPESELVSEIADIGEVVGEDASVAIPQGKIHSDIYESDGALFFSTHAAYYVRGGTESQNAYPGGHFISYDLSTGAFTDYGIGAADEGLITMTMDKKSGMLYALTWPSGLFISCDTESGRIQSFGHAVKGHSYKDDIETGIVPRYIGLDPRDGSAYWWNMDEIAVRHKKGADTFESLDDHSFSLPIMKAHREDGPDNPQWRAIRWSERDNLFYGVSYYSEYLFSYDPKTGDIEIIDRIAAAPNRKSGQLGGHATLAFDLSEDGRYIYYAPVSGGVRIVSYDLLLRRYTDHGALRMGDGRIPSDNDGLEIGRDGNIYLVCKLPLGETESEKNRAIINARYADESPEDVKKAFEICLVKVPAPLGNNNR